MDYNSGGGKKNCGGPYSLDVTPCNYYIEYPVECQLVQSYNCVLNIVQFIKVLRLDL